MDEHEGYFRMVTSTVWDEHNIYVLDHNLEITGQLEDFAPQWERFHSARFMGNRCYLVTFRVNIRPCDPLFVIDLGNPTAPEILGELEISGFSDYLHPYDENHIIGIGKETNSAGVEQGVKISLFDVSNVSNPKEIAKFEIGDGGTDSPVLRDHKALLFDRERNLLVLPVLVAEIDQQSYWAWTWGTPVWQGAYVFHISPEVGIQLEGKITHFDDGYDPGEYNQGYYSSSNSIERSLYIGDVIYTISDAKIQMNDLVSLEIVKKLELPGVES